MYRKIRDKYGRIEGYILQDKFGNIQEYTSYQLKTEIEYNHIVVDNLILTSDRRLVSTSKSISKEQIDKNTEKMENMGLYTYKWLLAERGIDIVGAMYLYLPREKGKLTDKLQLESYKNGLRQYGTVEDLLKTPEKFIGCFIDDRPKQVKNTENIDYFQNSDSEKERQKSKFISLIIHKDGQFKVVAFGVYEGIVKVHNNETLLRDDKISTTYLTVNANGQVIKTPIGINFSNKEQAEIADLIINSDLRYWGKEETIANILIALGKVKNRMELDNKLHGLASAGLTVGSIITYPIRMIMGY